MASLQHGGLPRKFGNQFLGNMRHFLIYHSAVDKVNNSSYGG